MRRFALLLMALFIPFTLSGQRPKAAGPPHKSLRQSIAAADSMVDSSKFKVEFGSDLRALKTGDSLPADVRLGVVVSNTFTIEASVAAQQDSSNAQGNYIEADVALGVTASLFPGATNYHGQYVFASPVLHYEGSNFQYGVKFGTGNRQVASTSAGMLARISAGIQHLFARDLLPAKNEAFVEVGVSFLK